MGKLLFLMLTITLANAQNITTVPSVIEGNLTTNGTSEGPSSTPQDLLDNFDFIVQWKYEMDEKRVPNYVITNIYEKKLPMKVSFQIYLAKIKDMNMENTTNMFTELGYEPSQIFSIDNLGLALRLFNMTFKTFYQKLSNQFHFAKESLEAVGIDPVQFSYANTFGTDEEAWKSFKQGNFSKESLQSALSAVNATLEDLFEFCKLEFIENFNNVNDEQLVGILGDNILAKETALGLWGLLNVTKEDISKIESVNALLVNFTGYLSNLKPWGVVVDSKRVAKNNEVVIREEEIKDFTNAQVTTLNSSLAVNITKESSVANSIHFFSYISNVNLSTISYDFAQNHLSNCHYFTSRNGSFYKINTSSPTVDERYINIPTDIGQEEFILGSPLLCAAKVYGLARSLESGKMTFDKFPSATSASSSVTTLSSTTINQSSKAYMLTISLALFIMCFLSKIF